MRASVRVPATSANLGPGFDALGLALSLYDEVSAAATEGPTRVTVAGEGAGELPADERHLVVRALHAGFEALGAAPPAVALTCHNRIPQARGLGSSAAAVVAGLLLARAMSGDAGDWLDDLTVLELASRLEGHPDNVAPCLHGGVTIAWQDESTGGAQAVRLDPAPELRPVVFLPEQHGLTAAARAALPASVPHPDAAHAAGRAALLVHALTTAPQVLFAATEDRLHQPYRAAGMPEAAALLHALRAAGAAAVISGAGPSVLALSPVPPGFEPGDRVLRQDLRVDLTGAVVGLG